MVLIKYSSKYVKIYFNMKIAYIYYIYTHTHTYIQYTGIYLRQKTSFLLLFSYRIL